jgi:transcriptional regulator with XRE-family HTH domain
MMIRAEREAKRMRQVELAKRAKVARSSLVMLEKGERKNPSFAILKTAVACGFSRTRRPSAMGRRSCGILAAPLSRTSRRDMERRSLIRKSARRAAVTAPGLWPTTPHPTRRTTRR